MRKADYDRRVVVTGLGVISSVGNDVDTAWTNLVNGVSGLGPITVLSATWGAWTSISSRIFSTFTTTSRFPSTMMELAR